MSDDDRAGLGSRIRAARERLGWSRETLAFHSGLSWSAIAQVESGRRTNVRPGTLAALSRALGISIDYLVDGARSRRAMLSHSLFIYRVEEQVRTTVGGFLAEGVERSEASTVVTTPVNIRVLRESLGSDADQVEFVVASDVYTSPGAALEAFRTFADAKLADGASWIRIVAEPIWARGPRSEVRVWARYESLFNLVFAAYPMTAVCLYDERAIAPEVIAQARLTHPQTIVDDRVVESPDYAEPRLFALEP